MPQVIDDPFADDKPVTRPNQAAVSDDPFADDKPLVRPKAPISPSQLQRPQTFERRQGDTLDPRAASTRRSLFQDTARFLDKSGLTPVATREATGAVEQFRQPGLGNKAMGALRYVNAPFKQAEAYLSDPAQYVMQKLGASPDTQKDVRDWTDALVDVAPAVLTGGASVAARAAARSLATREAASLAPEALDAAASAAFKDASKLGVKLKPGVYGQFMDTVQPTLRKLGAESDALAFDPKAYPRSASILDTFARVAPDARLSLDDVKAMQTRVNEFVRQALKDSEGGKPGTDLKLAQTLSRQFRDFTDHVMETGPLNKARDLWARKLKVDDIKWFIDRAKTLGDHDYLPSQMRQIALDPIEMKRFTPQEQKLIEEIARGSTAEDVARAATGHHTGVIGRGVRVAKALRPVDTKKAEELVKLIARGKGSQAVDDLPQQPGFYDQIKRVLGGS